VRVLYLDNSGALMLQQGSSLEVNSHDFLPQQVGAGACSLPTGTSLPLPGPQPSPASPPAARH
jgi:hypothetical protein